MQRELTGRHVALIFLTAFSVIIAVNLTLAFNAVRTFPGLEVKNSYVASQNFDRNRAEQQSLGWTVAAAAEDGKVTLMVTDTAGAPVEVAALEATLGRATHVKDDMTPSFVFDGERYVAHADLAAGNWNIRMVATAKDGTVFRQRVVLRAAKALRDCAEHKRTCGLSGVPCGTSGTDRTRSAGRETGVVAAHHPLPSLYLQSRNGIEFIPGCPGRTR